MICEYLCLTLFQDKGVIKLPFKQIKQMESLDIQKQNEATIKALKKIAETKWVGENTHRNIDFCLTGINLFLGVNSGWYKPQPIRINGLAGIYMINEDGSICAEARIIKVEENKYRMEYLSSAGYSEYEKYFSEFLNE